MNTARMANLLWKQSAKSDWRSFKSAASCPRQTQQSLLKTILNKACASQFAERYRLSPDMSVADFRKSVPVTNYAEHYVEDIKRIQQGEPYVLTNQQVYRLVPTTGSSGKVKLIPYTRLLKRSFQRVVNTWIYDLARQYPQAFRGKSYWSVTPVVKQPFGESVVPVGFESDAAYLSPIGRLLAKRAIVEAPFFDGNETAETVIRLTALQLLSESNLSLISVWSPTLLLNILSTIWNDQEALLRALAAGDDRFVKRNDSGSILRLKRNPKRARWIERVFDALRDQTSLAKSVWPRLSLISCWGDAGSKTYFKALKKLEPQIPVQAKGILSTEGCVSLPMGTSAGHLPAIESSFLEFIPESANGEVLLLDQLEIGQVYEVLITTFGGLYRYATGDQIKVTAICDGLPNFELMGRTNQMIDLVGEKVPLRVIEQATLECLGLESAPERFWVVAPVAAIPAYYRIYISGLKQSRELEKVLLNRLRKNPHFSNAESLGQIVKPEIRSLPDSFTIHSFHSLKSQLGNQLGALKESRVEYSSRVVTRLDQLSTPLENEIVEEQAF